MTSAEAMAGLVAIIGPVGITGALVAFFGYKAQAAKGRPDASVPPVAVSSVPIAAKDVELLTNAVTMHHTAVMRLGLVLEWCHVEREGRQEDFREFVERRELHAEIAALRAQKARPPA